MYKIFPIEEINVLNQGRFAGTSATVRKSLDGLFFITQLKTGVSENEGETFLTHSEALALMEGINWKN